MPHASEIVVEGLRSPLLQAGEPGGRESVVFVHGNPGSCRDWEDLVGRIGEFGRAVAFDMPGFGRASKRPDFDYTVAGYARFLARALAELGIEKVHLVLHDFGGPFGLAWAAKHPEAFASVVLINTGVLIGYRWHYLAKIWRSPILGELFQVTATRPVFRLLLKHGNPRGLPPEFVDRMYDDYDRGTRRAVLKLYRATSPGGFGGLVSVLRELDRPALVVWGKHDPYIPLEQAERQKQVFPHAEITVLDESGHWPFADDPNRVAELVVGFLRRHLGTS